MRRRLVVKVVVWAVVGAACGSSSSPPESSVPAAPETSVADDPAAPDTSTAPSDAPSEAAPVAPPGLSIEEAVAGLESADPAAMLAILDELNIGVYTASGAPVIPGSEDSEDDLWLVSELLPGLAAAHAEPGPTFGEFALALPGVADGGVSAADLAAGYDNMVDVLPDHPMSRVLTALGTEFESDARLSRLEAWLLLVALIPPNEANDAHAGGELLVMAGGPLAAGQIRCEDLKGDGSDSGFSLAQSYADAAAGEASGSIVGELADGFLDSKAVTTVASVVKLIGDGLGHINKLLDIAKAAQIVVNVDIQFTAFTEDLHRVHQSGRTPGVDRTQLTVTIEFEGVTSETEFGCNFAGMLGLPAAGTGIPDAQVQITLDETLTEHGFVERSDDQPSLQGTTGPDGRYQVDYATKQEKTDSGDLADVFIREESGRATASFSVMTALGQLFNTFAGVEWIADILGLNERYVDLTVAFHDPAVQLTKITDMTGFWSGSRALNIETCDGVNWTGFIVLNLSGSAAGATMSMTGDSPFGFTLPAGSDSAEVPVTLATTMTVDVEDAHVENVMTQAGTLSLSLSRTGVAHVELDMEAGTQDITATADGQTVFHAAATEAFSESYDLDMNRAACAG